MIIEKKPRTFVPENLEIKWENLEPLFEELKNREINSVDGLETWLKNRSELEAALEENFAWRYIKMTCDTSSEKKIGSKANSPVIER